MKSTYARQSKYNPWMLDKTDEVTFKDIDVCVEYWSIKVTSLKPPVLEYETSAAMFEFLHTKRIRDAVPPETVTPQVMTSPTLMEFIPPLKLSVVDVTFGVTVGVGATGVGVGVGATLGK